MRGGGGTGAREPGHTREIETPGWGSMKSDRNKRTERGTKKQRQKKIIELNYVSATGRYEGLL